MAKATTTNGMNGIESIGAIHLTLQGKGGVGKSLVASILAQYLRDKGKDVRCIDTDPVNRTFAQYAALGADRLNLRDEHNRIESHPRITRSFSPAGNELAPNRSRSSARRGNVCHVAKNQ